MTNTELTEKVLADPNSCPYCEGEISASEVDLGGDGASLFRNITCSDCGKEWTETYKLTFAEVLEA